MAIKRLLCRERVRRVPAQFSWVDQRLVRERHIERCDVHALALYLFLVTVADADGLSWYGEAALCRQLGCNGAQLQSARAELERAALIAYRQPLYQVLDLAPVATAPASAPSARRPTAEAVSVGAVLHQLLAGGAR